tara:strand:- start:66 stop:527 length:462 start_codon:yes stop_codon:yes gene_type:complete
MSGPDKWGPHGWKFIHYVTLGYPDKPTKEDKNKYKNFFISLSDVIPCMLCKMNYKDHLNEIPIDDSVLKNKESMMEWGIKVHNLVNISNNKKIISVNDGINMIKNDNDTCKENLTNMESTFRKKVFIYISPIIIFGIILIFQIVKVYYERKSK